MPLPSPRRAARAVLDAVDRALHPLRRRAVVARLRAVPPRSILFICHGNICRSPFAAAILTRQLAAAGNDDLTAASAGIIGPDRPSPPEAVAAARAFGVDLATHRSQLLTAGLARAYDLIVVMDPRQRAHVLSYYGRQARDVRLLGDLDPEGGLPRTIQDPVDRPRAVFDDCYARIARCTAALAAAVPAQR